jgi:hypothetical protein
VSYYFIFAVYICMAFIVLTTLCKSLFGRELLYRSLNTIVDVYDTPDGAQTDRIDWCARAEGAFGLRHSLYNNPEAVKKIAAYINRVCSPGDNWEVAAAATRPSETGRRRWSPSGALVTAVSAAIVAALVATVIAVVLMAYAPPGSTSISCTVKTYFQRSRLEGGFTILVTRLENDGEGVGDRLAEEIKRRYSLPVIQTCLEVTDVFENGQDDSSIERLSSRYNAGLILWGKVVQGKQVELRVRPLDGHLNRTQSIALTPAFVPEFVAKQLRHDLFGAIYFSALIASSNNSPANLADYADRVEAIVQSADWSDDSLSGVSEHIRMYVSAGRLMLKAALANHDGQRVKKAIAYFVRASSTIDSSDSYKQVLSRDWENDYRFALLSDARLNKVAESAQLAASIYLHEYNENLKNLNVASEDLAADAEVTASAFSELYSITQSQEAAHSAIRLACENLVWLRYSLEGAEERERRSIFDRKLTPQEEKLRREYAAERQRKFIRQVELSEASNILTRFGKNPSAIFIPGSRMKVEACKTF